MNLQMNGRVAVITGGSSGIGLETARILLEEGANVVICGRDLKRLHNAADSLAAGERLLTKQCDVLRAEDVKNLHDETLERFGGVDALVCNAGEAREGNFFTNTEEDWRRELELKFFSYIHPIKTFVDTLRRSLQASIVCVNSTVSTQPEPHLMTSSSSRGGVLNLAKSLSHALGPQIRVNSVLMGCIASGQWERRYEKRAAPGQTYAAWLLQEAARREIPLRRFGEPREAAKAIAFLASAASSYITGARLEVSGGISRHV